MLYVSPKLKIESGVLSNVKISDFSGLLSKSKCKKHIQEKKNFFLLMMLCIYNTKKEKNRLCQLCWHKLIVTVCISECLVKKMLLHLQKRKNKNMQRSANEIYA